MDSIKPERSVPAFRLASAAGSSGDCYDQAAQRLTAGRVVPQALDGQGNSHSVQPLWPIIALVFLR